MQHRNRNSASWDATKKLWRQQITINGKRKVFSAKTKNEVQEKIRAYKNELSTCPTLGDAANKWESKHWEEIRSGTWRCYTAPLRRIIDQFGQTPLDKISPKDVQAFLNKLGTKYASKSVTHHKNIISMIYKFAMVEMDQDIRNPAEHVSVQHGLRKTTRTALDPFQKRIVSNIENSQDFILPYLIYWTGCRCGEALALQMKDIDFEERTISVNKAVAHQGNQPIISAPKTENAYRMIPLLPPLEKRLETMQLGPNDYIASGTDKPLTKSALDKRWKKWCKEYGLIDERGKTMIDRHMIRHQYATTLYEAGIEPKSAQHLMGHADIKTTMEIYTHISKAQFQRDAERLAQFTASAK